MKRGDLVRHKTYGHTGLVMRLDDRPLEGVLNLLVMWIDWPNLPQTDNHTWARRVEIEVISETQG
jgi:hypothetical protein